MISYKYQESWGREHFYDEPVSHDEETDEEDDFDAGRTLVWVANLMRSDPRTADILLMRAVLGLTLEEIGRRHSITRARVQQLTEEIAKLYPTLRGVLCDYRKRP